jgi:8-oxo-dGTP diphosphatase
MIEYVCGLAFTPGDPTRPNPNPKLVLIKKTHPRWQAGRYNGIGGKLEPGESPVEAMVREFREEAGVITPRQDWQHFLTLGDDEHWRVYFFAMQHEVVRLASTMTDERVERHEVEWWLQMGNLVSHLKWIIPLAMQREQFSAPVLAYERPWVSATEPVPAEVAHE